MIDEWIRACTFGAGSMMAAGCAGNTARCFRSIASRFERRSRAPVAVV